MHHSWTGAVMECWCGNYYRMSIEINLRPRCAALVFFFNNRGTTEIYPLSLHDPLPIYVAAVADAGAAGRDAHSAFRREPLYGPGDRKSTRLNSSHRCISYAVFCLK